MQYITTYASYQYQHGISCTDVNCTINNAYNIAEKSVLIRSDTMEINYPKYIQFYGNVNIKHSNHTLISDQLTIYYNNKKNLIYTIYANGNINYNNNNITLIGQQAWINLNNNNINIYKSTYFLTKSYINGSANAVMQRENNRYTIIKHGNFTSCLNDNHWNITAKKIIYDNIKNNIDIWDACFKIKKIPIFYSPYLFLSLNKNNISASYIPNIKYSNKYGLILKIPCPIYSSKYFSGNISPYYISNIGIKLQTKINYSIYPCTGLIIFNIIRNNQINKNASFNKKHRETSGNLYWENNSFIHKKWNFNTHYTSKNYSHYFNNINSNYVNTFNNYINQKFICNYNNKNWNASIAYLGYARNTTTKNNYNNYTAAPQLTLNSYYNFYIHKNPCTIKIFNQLTKFIPEIYFYPEAIRIHIEPSVHCTLHNNWSNLNIETKLKFTHYQQKNINYYNITQYMPHHLKNTVNRIIPQFKIHNKIILKNKTHILKKYQYFLESKLQYLYIPYYFQEKIGIYDSSVIHIDYNNLFNDSIYSGLDRIAPANRITGNIVIHYTKNNHELFYISIGQILNFSQSYLKNINSIQKKHISMINSILLSGASHWNIHNHWNTHTEIQYDTQYHILSFGTAILEYIGNNNHILQTHYRYINSQYIKQTSFNSNKSIYPKTITQFGLLTYIPIKDNWKINFAHYHNIKTKKLIDQIIGIQYHTSCWNINTSFERKIIGFNKIYKNSIYDNKIRFDIKISYAQTNFNANPYKIFNKNMLPYQYVF